MKNLNKMNKKALKIKFSMNSSKISNKFAKCMKLAIQFMTLFLKMLKYVSNLFVLFKKIQIKISKILKMVKNLMKMIKNNKKTKKINNENPLNM